MSGTSRRDRDRGSASIELAVLASAVLALFVTVMIGGRTTLARQAIDIAAYDAARTASLARDQAAAQTQAQAAAAETLSHQGLNCVDLTVTVDTHGFTVPAGQPATVTATVTCLVGYSDIALPGMPGNATLTSSFVSPLDQYRGRTP
jgi:Flp pilus assembly protein TadG